MNSPSRADDESMSPAQRKRGRRARSLLVPLFVLAILAIIGVLILRRIPAGVDGDSLIAFAFFSESKESAGPDGTVIRVVRNDGGATDGGPFHVWVLKRSFPLYRWSVIAQGWTSDPVTPEPRWIDRTTFEINLSADRLFDSDTVRRVHW